MADYTPRELEMLARRLEPAMRRAFEQAIAGVRSQVQLDLLASLLQAGQMDADLSCL